MEAERRRLEESLARIELFLAARPETEPFPSTDLATATANYLEGSLGTLPSLGAQHGTETHTFQSALGRQRACALLTSALMQ